MVELVKTRVVTLAEVAEFVRGITFKPNDIEDGPTDTNVDCLRTKNVQASLDTRDVWAIDPSFVKRPNQYVAEGDILISSANSWSLVGKCSWIPRLSRPTTFGGFVTVLRPRDDSIDSRYLYHWFSSARVQRTIRSFANQTTNISNLDLKRSASLTLPFPSLDEQRRIAVILDKADDLRTKRRQALLHVDELVQSAFRTRFGNVVGNTRGWQCETFEDIAPSRLGKMLDKNAQSGKHLRKYLRNANVQWFDVDTSDLAQMDFDEKSRSTFQLAYGDVLICEGGEPGRAAIWRAEIEDCYYQKAVHRARPNTALATPEYIVYLLWHLSKGGGLADHVTAATIAHLTGEKLKRMKVPVPPLQIQQDFAAEVASAERLKEYHRAQLRELDTLFISLQHRAFQGEL